MSVNLYSVVEEAEKKLLDFSIEDSLAQRSATITSTLYSINPGYEDFDRHVEIRIVLLDKSKDALRKLIFLSWYLPDKNHGVLLRQAIQSQIENNRDLVELEFPLTSKGHCRIYLGELAQRKGPSYLFGNILNKKEWEPKILLSLYRIKRTRNYKTYKDRVPEKRYIGVGYNDKGTKAGDPRGGIQNFMLTSLQNQIEDNRDITETTKLFLEGFLM